MICHFTNHRNYIPATTDSPQHHGSPAATQSHYGQDPGVYDAHYSHWRRCHDDQQQVEQAKRVAEMIGHRNFENRIAQPSPYAGVGYGVLIGGATFFALSLPGMMLARRLSGTVGKRVAYGGLKLVAGIAAGTVGSRYAHHYTTMENLKIMGTHLSPNEPSASADAICQHPLISQALQEQKTRVPMMDQWGGNGFGYGYQSHSWQSSRDRQILSEFESVLANCQERNDLIVASKTDTTSPDTSNARGKKRRGW